MMRAAYLIVLGGTFLLVALPLVAVIIAQP